MSYIIHDVDRDVLPTALLDIAKQHMRVDFVTDDEYIKLCLARAIDIFERISGWRVNPATVDWIPAITATATAYKTPVQPVGAFKVNSGGVEVSADYELRFNDETSPYFLASKANEAWPGDASTVLTVGYTDEEELPMAALDCVLRVAATLYERRETVDSASLALLPGWANELITGIWIPRC